jgi:hypothetical protein
VRLFAPDINSFLTVPTTSLDDGPAGLYTASNPLGMLERAELTRLCIDLEAADLKRRILCFEGCSDIEALVQYKVFMHGVTNHC